MKECPYPHICFDSDIKQEYNYGVSDRFKRCPKCGDDYEVGVIIKTNLKQLEVCEECSVAEKLGDWLLKVYKGGNIIS